MTVGRGQGWAASEWHPKPYRPARLESLYYPVLVVSTDKLTTLGVQNVHVTTTECAAPPVLAKRLFCNHACMLTSIKSYRPANKEKESHRYIPMMVHASTMGIGTGNSRSEQMEQLLDGFSASGTGNGRSAQTELLLSGFSAPGTGYGRSEQPELLPGGL